MFLTEDGGFPLMVSLGYGVPLRTKLYLGRLRPKGEQRKKRLHVASYVKKAPF